MNFLIRLFTKKPIPSTERASPFDKEVVIGLERAAELRQNGQFELAIIECSKVLSLQPNNQLAYHIRALAKYAVNDRDGAIEDWKKLQTLHNILK